MADTRTTRITSAIAQEPPTPSVNDGEIQLDRLHPRVEDGGLSETQETSNATAALAPIELAGIVKLKLMSAAFCFFNAGVNDGSLGALIPYVLHQYQRTTSWMAIPYGVGFFGWLLIAVFGGYLRVSFGTGGIIIAGAALQLLAQLLRFWIPPFGLFAATFLFVTLGQALQDSQANTFVSTLKNAHRWLGVIHGCYSIGTTIGPLIAAAIASRYEGKWASFYCVPMGIGVINLLLCSYAFRDETSLYERIKHRHTEQGSAAPTTARRSTAARVELVATLKLKSIWLISMFYFLHLGAAFTAGGWVVEFLHVVRGGPLSQVGYISSAFYGGAALGRFVLAEPTFRFGEKRMLTIYCITCVGLQLVFWRVPNIVVDAVSVSLIGFFLGPLFVTGVSVASKLIPTELQSSGLALTFVVAQAGGAMLPAITGVISAKSGVATLQPILVGLLAAMTVAWFVVPNPKSR